MTLLLDAGVPVRLDAVRAAPRMPLLRDPRVRSVPWTDLRRPTRSQTVRELFLTAPWLGASLWFASRGELAPAAASSFMFFLTGIRQAHGAQHYTLGLSRRATERAMFVLSALMLGSMHAVQVTHVRHHARCLADDDEEGFTARLPWWGAVLAGPLFSARIIDAGLRRGTPRQVRWIRAELGVTVALLAAAAVLPVPLALAYHLGAMCAGHALTGFFLVWTVHHDCDGVTQVARTLRRRLATLVSCSMFFHLEHHLFPDVPTCNLAELSRRLDRAAPELQERRVF